MKISKTPFGLLNGYSIELYTLINDNGVELSIMNYGATITSLKIPNQDGGKTNIVCGFDRFDDYFSETYKNNAPYFGCTVGRYCSQIKDSKFTLNGEEFQLAANCGPNNLHGGVVGFDKQIWKVKETQKDNSVELEMSLSSKDGDEGYPGNVEAKVTIALNNDDEIGVNYHANTDKATPLSMTNHSYFNLSGFNESIEDHVVKVTTNKRLQLDETGAATGEIVDISNKADDLRTKKTIKDVHGLMGDGFEHFYVFDSMEMNKKAVVSHAATGRSLEVYSSEPCMLFYTAKYTSDELQRNAEEKYGKYRAFCCETHRYPNGPNIPGSPGSITKAKEEFKSTTIFKLKY